MTQSLLHLSLRADPLGPPGDGSIGGQQIFVRQTAETLPQWGFALDIATVGGRGPEVETIALGPHGRVIRFPATDLPGAPEHAWRETADRLVDRMLAWIREQGANYRIVHSHYWISGLVARELADRLHIPWVHSPYKLGQWVLRPGESLSTARYEIERALLERADAAVVSYLNEGELVHSMAPDVPLYVVPPGVDVTRFRPLPAGPTLTALGIRRPPLLYAGRLNNAQGLSQLLEAFADLPWPDDCRLVVIGGGEHDVDRGRPRSPRLRQLADRLPSRVIFAGPVAHGEMPAYMAAACALLAPNQGPVVGLGILEALAAGTAVIGTDVTGVRDWIDEGVNGYVVPRHRLDLLARRALALWADPAEARRLGQAGLQKVNRHYTMPQMAARLAAVYQDVQRGQTPTDGTFPPFATNSR